MSHPANNHSITRTHGLMRSITGDVPSAGAEITHTVPARHQWRLLAVYYSLVTAVAAATRLPYLSISDGSNTLLTLVPSSTQLASLTYRYSWSEIGHAGGLNGIQVACALPPLILPAGSIIATSTLAIQGADAYTAPQLLVEEWLTGTP